MLYIGVDIGGMSVKAGVVDEEGKILFKDTAVTNAQAPAQDIAADIAALVRSVAERGGVSLSSLGGVGVGSPGSVNDAAGVIRYSCNINFRETPLAAMLSDMLGVKNVRLSNDANCAALGETLFGAGRGAKNSVTVTLGTGVGTGIVVDGRLLTGNQSAARAISPRVRKADTSSSRRAARSAAAANAAALRRTPQRLRSCA